MLMLVLLLQLKEVLLLPLSLELKLLALLILLNEQKILRREHAKEN